jgi:GABA permease
LKHLRQLGAEVDGAVGDIRPADAIADVVETTGFDEIVICTLPFGASKWLRQDLPRATARRYGIPVTHLTSRSSAIAPSLVTVA